MLTKLLALAIVLVAVLLIAQMFHSRAGDDKRGAAGTRREGLLMPGKEKIDLSEAEWKKLLTDKQFDILHRKGTERPHTGRYNKHHAEGIYTCAGCGQPLFASGTKYDSGSGWPSFYQPLDEDAVADHRDTSNGMVRTEVTCARCGGHLGHVFEDGPEPTGLRYCINSAALSFAPEEKVMGNEETKPLATAMFAAGCFWGVEAAFRQVEGVVRTSVGYTGGHAENPTYRQVCGGGTGHAETVRVVYDPRLVSYDKLLEVFWQSHDPTQVNRQGPDVGSQYRSAVFTMNDEQREAAEKSKRELEASDKYRRPVVTEIVTASTFWRAEKYHQQYLEKSGAAACRIRK